MNPETIIVGYQMPVSVPGDTNTYFVADFKDLIIWWRKKKMRKLSQCRLSNVLTEYRMT